MTTIRMMFYKIWNFLFGWKYIGNYSFTDSLAKKMHPNMIRILDKKANKVQARWIRKWHKKNRGKAPLGRTVRGIKVEPNTPGCVVYAKGKTFKYKAIQSKIRWIDNHGHGGGTSQGMDIYRKLRKK